MIKNIFKSNSEFIYIHLNGLNPIKPTDHWANVASVWSAFGEWVLNWERLYQCFVVLMSTNQMFA